MNILIIVLKIVGMWLGKTRLSICVGVTLLNQGLPGLFSTKQPFFVLSDTVVGWPWFVCTKSYYSSPLNVWIGVQFIGALCGVC